MAMRRALPGYYFDEEKQKYFRVLPNHVAPAGSRYSRASVKSQQQLEQARWKAEAADRRPRSVRRSVILQKSLDGAVLLARELGHTRPGHRERDGAAAFVTGLEHRTVLELDDDENISALAEDPSTGALFLGVRKGAQYSLMSTTTSSREDEAPLNQQQLRRVFSPTSPVSLLTSLYFESPFRMWQGHQPQLRSTHSTCVGQSNEASINLTKLFKPGQVQAPWDVGVYVFLRPQAHTSVWTSACAPSGGSIGIGTDQGIIMVEERDSGVPAGSRSPDSTPPLADWHTRSLHTASDVLALDWLSATCLVAGQRNGCVDLFDTRVPPALQSSNPVLAVRHPSAVAHVRVVRDQRLVVSGLKNSLCMYDLRFLHPPSPSKTFPNATKAIRKYEHANEYRLGSGFDVDVDLGIIAAAQDDMTVQLFGLETGDKLASAVSATPFGGYPQAVHFSQDPHGLRPPALLVGVENRVHQFAW
ncbi:MAG: hypothetical protein M1838_002010 [Thelocarpon superellum]|nr:MAG: hypothetical protein M1838_002010 [Thelocarpon superellum]